MNNQELFQKDDTVKRFITNLQDWLYFYLNQWKKLFVIGVIGAIIGLIVAMSSKASYVAELLFALEEKGSSSSMSGIASQLGLDLGGSSSGGVFAGENNLELLKSRFIIEQALLSSVNINGKEELLINRYIDFNNLRKGWEEIPEMKNITFLPDEKRENFGKIKDGILYNIYKSIKGNNLSVSKIDKKLNIINVTVVSKDELFSKYFTEVLVNTASNFYIQTKTKKSSRNLAILELRLDSVRRALDDALIDAAINKDQNTNIIKARGGVGMAKKQLNVQVLTTMYGELLKNTELAKSMMLREEPIIFIIDRPILPLEVLQLQRTKSIIVGSFVGLLVGLIILTIIRFWKSIMA